MAYKDGQWVPEDDSVASHVAKLQSEDSPMMRGAIASGLKGANRRGMINSTMGIGAGIAAGLGMVTPIAGQDAGQAHAKNFQAVEDKRSRDLTTAQIASADRGNYVQTLASLSGNYSNAISNTLQNHKIPKDSRLGVQADIQARYRADQQQLAAFYGVKLDWGA